MCAARTENVMSFNGDRGRIQWRWLALASLLAAQVNAQEPAAPLSLDQAMRLALENNPSLTAARREVGATEGQMLQGSLRPNPEFTYQADDARKASRTSTYELGVPIEIGGKRDARIRAATLGRDVAQADLGSTELRLRSAVIAAFFDVLTAQALLATTEDSVKIAQRATDIAAKRVLPAKFPPLKRPVRAWPRLVRVLHARRQRASCAMRVAGSPVCGVMRTRNLLKPVAISSTCHRC
jgi:cobalt-zinc-cadmium efflux system outer membrane protein